MNNQVALLKAIRDEDLADVQRLVDAGGVYLNPPPGVYSNHPLLVASYKGHVDIVLFLLDCGADVNQTDENRWTALIKAADSNRANVVLLLLQRGAHVNAHHENGWTALHHAAIDGSVDVIRVLLDHGADRTLKNNKGETAEDLARLYRKLDAEDLLRNYVPVPQTTTGAPFLAPQPLPTASVAHPSITGQTDELASLRAQLQANTDELALASAQHASLTEALESANAARVLEIRALLQQINTATEQRDQARRELGTANTALTQIQSRLDEQIAAARRATETASRLRAERDQARQQLSAQITAAQQASEAAARRERELETLRLQHDARYRQLEEQMAASARESANALTAARADVETHRQRATTAEQQRNRAAHDLQAADSTIRELESGFHSAYRLLGSFLNDAVPLISERDLVINRAMALGHGSNGWVKIVYYSTLVKSK